MPLPRTIRLFLFASLLLFSLEFWARHATAASSSSLPHQEEHLHVIHTPPLGATAHYLHTQLSLGPLGNRSSLETPFSIMNVSHDVMRNQQARNLNDLALYLPSVQLEERGDPNTSRPQSRGFEADIIANSRLDGLNMVITTPYAAEQFSNLQVLNGLAGALYGPQSPAGTFDYTLKRPTRHSIERFSFGFDSQGSPLEAIDFSGTTGQTQWFGYRLNLLNQQGRSYVKGSHIRRALASGDIDIHLSSHTILQIDASQYSYAERGLAGQFSYSATHPLPNAPLLSHPGYGQKQGGFNTETDTFLTKLTHHFNRNWSLSLGGLYQNAYRNVFSVTNQLTDSIETYHQTLTAAGSVKNFRTLSTMAYVNGSFKTGFLSHHIELGSNGYWLRAYNPLRNETESLGNATLSHPQEVNSPQPHFYGTYKSSELLTQNILGGDTLSWGRHWSLLSAFSWSWIHTQNVTRNTISSSNTHQRAALSPQISLIYKITPQQSLYTTWGRSINAGPIAPVGSVNANTVLPPLRSEEYEIGYKLLLHPHLQINVAAFRMTRPYGYTDPTTHVFGLFGQQRNYGTELQITGSFTDHLNIIGGVTWLNARLGQTGTASTSHKNVVGVPPLQANVLLDYQIPAWPSAAVNATFHYTARRAANVYNTTSAASYVTLDFGARYSFSLYKEPLVIRFGITNVTNQRYWASVYPTSINGGGTASNAAVAGLPRAYHTTLDIAF